VVADKGRPDLRLRRAGELIEDLRRSIEGYLADGSFGVVGVPNEAEHCIEFTLRVIRDPPLDQWATLFADAIHNMRVALDQLAWELDPAAEGGQRRTSFPILRKPPKSWPPASVARMPSEAQSIIQSLQPYHAVAAAGGREDPDQHFLAIIQDLDNSDKHRVTVVPAAPIGGDRVAGLPFGASIESTVFPRFIDGEPVMRVRLPADELLTRPLRCEVFVDIRVAEFPTVSLLVVLDDLFGRLHRDVVDPLMPFARG
jgi:hypothetical protein